MNIACKPGCKKKDDRQTTVKLNVDSNTAICDDCGDTIEVSEFVKLSLKQMGKVLRSEKYRAYVYPCQTCNKDVEINNESYKLSGVGCDKPSCCKIDLSQPTRRGK